MRQLVSTSLLLIALSVPLLAQKAPVKFGKISKEEVAQRFYEPDSTVDAAVLCEYGSFNAKELTFTHTIRYKIYSKEGLNSLIMSIPVQSKAAVKGVVFNMEDGEIVESKMKKESIYQQRIIGNYSRMRIAPPDAKAGSVIDIRYTMQGIPNKWQFQKHIPVLWSELRIPYSQYYKFNQRFIGYEPLHLATSGRWVAKDMPAFLPEPYINSSTNYMNTMFIEVSEFHYSGGSGSGTHRFYSSSWENVSDYYWDHRWFGGMIRSSCAYLNDAAEELKNMSATQEELVINALERIRADVKWDKSENLYPSVSLRDVYVKEKIGNSADMNFLYLKLLKKLEVECYPMVMSTRSEGIVNFHFPSRSRFNYTVAYVKIGDEFQVIDASNKYYGFDMLNRSCLNGAGFLVKEENPKWVTIEPDKKMNKMTKCVLNISEDGFIEGSMLIQHGGYAAASFRKRNEQYTTQDEYLEVFEQDNPGIFVMDYTVENTENDLGTIKETFAVEVDGVANVSGGMIYLDPLLVNRLDENPFKLESRLYPVDFAYGRDIIYLLTMIIPDGYVAEQLPVPIRLVTSDRSAIYVYTVTFSGNTIQLMSRLNIKKPVYLQNEYDELRNFYSIIVNKGSEPIILKRVNP